MNNVGNGISTEKLGNKSQIEIPNNNIKNIFYLRKHYYFDSEENDSNKAKYNMLNII